MNFSEKEVESVSKLEPFERYKYFIKKAADWERMYSLKGKNNDFVIAEMDDFAVISFWPAKEFIKGFKIDEGYSIVEVSLDDFRDELYDFIKSGSYLINIFSVDNKTGFVVTLDEFVRDLNEELRKYE